MKAGRHFVCVRYFYDYDDDGIVAVMEVFDLSTWRMAELAVETWSVVCQSGDVFLSTLVFPPTCSLMHLHGLTFTY